MIYHLQCDGRHWRLLSEEFQWPNTASCLCVNQTTCLGSGVCNKIGTSVPPRQSDCDKSTVLVCLSGGGGMGMANDFYTDV